MTPHSRAMCAPTSAVPKRRNGFRWRSPTAVAPPRCPARRCRRRRRSTSTTSRSPRFRPPLLRPPNPVPDTRRQGTMTNPVSIITTDLVLLDVDAGADKESVIDRLAGAARRERTGDRPRSPQSRRARPGGAVGHRITGRHRHSALPLGRGVDPSIGFARLSPKVDFGAPDGPADLVFLIAAPDGAGSEHMKLLSSLARALVRPDFVAVAAGGEVRRRGRRAGRRRGQPGRCRTGGRLLRPKARSGRIEVDHRDHRLPDRHRPHLHGRRRAETGRRARGGRT